MNDHELDDQIRFMAESYNEPPATPRDAMWSRIQSAREERAIVAVGTPRRMHWLRTGAGIAAVLAVGIGIGRLSSDAGNPPSPSTLASVARPVSPDNDARDSVNPNGAPLAGDAERGAPVGSLASASPGAQSTNPVRATRAERLAALSEGRRAPDRALTAYGVPRGVPGAVGEGSEMSAYRLAVVEHMARTEILLTSFLADSRTSPNDARTAAQFAALSRDLLKTTRLLLATRTTEDAALTRLLEDLELVLMQISQYSSEGRRGDLDAINQSIDRRNVLPKLRSTIPAGASAATGI